MGTWLPPLSDTRLGEIKYCRSLRVTNDVPSSLHVKRMTKPVKRDLGYVKSWKNGMSVE